MSFFSKGLGALQASF